MINAASGKTALSAAVLAGAFWISACAANQSIEAAAPMAGSSQATLAVKMPGVYGLHLPAADQAVPDQGPAAMPGSAQALLVAKAPGVYGPHLAAADAAPAPAAASTCQPGSSAAVIAAKLPPNARPGDPERYKDCR